MRTDVYGSDVVVSDAAAPLWDEALRAVFRLDDDADAPKPKGKSAKAEAPKAKAPKAPKPVDLMSGKPVDLEAHVPKAMRKAARDEAKKRGLDVDAVVTDLLHAWLTGRS